VQNSAPAKTARPARTVHRPKPRSDTLNVQSRCSTCPEPEFPLTPIPDKNPDSAGLLLLLRLHPQETYNVRVHCEAKNTAPLYFCNNFVIHVPFSV